MKYSYHTIIIILAATVLLAVYSFAKPTVNIGGEPVKKSDIYMFMMGDSIPVTIDSVYTSEYTPRTGVDSSSQKILLIGDSMLEQFRWRLRDYCKEKRTRDGIGHLVQLADRMVRHHRHAQIFH